MCQLYKVVNREVVRNQCQSIKPFEISAKSFILRFFTGLANKHLLNKTVTYRRLREKVLEARMFKKFCNTLDSMKI